MQPTRQNCPVPSPHTPTPRTSRPDPGRQGRLEGGATPLASAQPRAPGRVLRSAEALMHELIGRYFLQVWEGAVWRQGRILSIDAAGDLQVDFIYWHRTNEVGGSQPTACPSSCSSTPSPRWRTNTTGCIPATCRSTGVRSHDAAHPGPPPPTEASTAAACRLTADAEFRLELQRETQEALKEAWERGDRKRSKLPRLPFDVSSRTRTRSRAATSLRPVKSRSCSTRWA